MILISHRGNTFGKNELEENKPSYINKAINNGYDVEIDVWYIQGEFYLGHDNPEYHITIDWLNNFSNKLWIHCKNIDSVVYFNKIKSDLHYFWHEKDTVTLTSKNYIWVYPGNQPIKDSIAVMPEIHQEKINDCIGICSDFIQNYTIL